MELAFIILKIFLQRKHSASLGIISTQLCVAKGDECVSFILNHCSQKLNLRGFL
jgi:hypothetical protein